MSDREETPTAVLDPRELMAPSWALVFAMLEKLGTWPSLAMRLGTLALLQECTRAMAQPDAPASLVSDAQTLLDALRRMPWERK